MFSAVDMTKDEIRAIEEAYAKTETPVVSNNSAHRWTPDVPMMIPEINADHAKIIEQQKGRLGTKRGFIAVKPNCSIQSYTPALAAWREFEPYEVVATTYQAISERARPSRTGRRWWRISFPISAVRRRRARRSRCASLEPMRTARSSWRLSR